MLPHQNKPDHSGVRNTVYIISTLKVPSVKITGITEKEWNTFKLVLILEVMIGTFHNTLIRRRTNSGPLSTAFAQR